MKAAMGLPSGWTLPAAVYALWLLAGTVIFLAPGRFHALTPSVALLGPFNAHFIRDVGPVYVASGLYGVRTACVPLCFAAALWSFFHAVFHLHVWVARGVPLDGIFLFDLSFVIVPPVFVVLSLLTKRSQPETNL